jgi:hypothetical protein
MDILAGNTGDGGGGGAAGSIIFLLIYAVVFVIVIAGMWKTFEKANVEGWWAIIPFANWYHLVKISGKEWWWFLLLFVPCVDIVAILVISMAVAERFGKSAGFGIGLWILPYVFYPMLGFGDAEYQPAPAV